VQEGCVDVEIGAKERWIYVVFHKKYGQYIKRFFDQLAFTLGLGRNFSFSCFRESFREIFVKKIRNFRKSFRKNFSRKLRDEKALQHL
jgi:hypothetical protein